jgi:sugar diacid utilization regulator
MALDPRITGAADRWGFPLFTVPKQVPYSIIFTGVYERIFSKQIAGMVKSEEINSALTKALFAKDSVEAIARTLSGFTKKTVAILDEGCRPISGCPASDIGRGFVAALKTEEARGALCAMRDGGGRTAGANDIRHGAIKLGSRLYEIGFCKSFSGNEYVGGIVLLLDGTGQGLDQQGGDGHRDGGRGLGRGEGAGHDGGRRQERGQGEGAGSAEGAGHDGGLGQERGQGEGAGHDGSRRQERDRGEGAGLAEGAALGQQGGLYERQVDMLALSHSATSLAIVHMKKRAVMEAEDKMRGDLYSSLLDGTARAEGAASMQAAKLGIPLNGVYCVAEMKICYARPAALDGGRIAANAECIFEPVRRSLRQFHEKNALIAKKDGCFMVLNLARGVTQACLDEKIQAVFSCAKGAAAGLPASPEILIGVGGMQESLMRIAMSGGQAGRALRLGSRVARGRGVFNFGKMGVYSLLDVDSMEDFSANCAQELGLISRLCGENANTYLDTLEAYFDLGESMTAAAKSLDIHVNTVKYRINKLKEALGEAVFSDGQEKMRIYLLTKMRKLL